MCVFPCISLQFLWGFLHCVTLQLVSLLMLFHFSLITTLFCFISLDTLLAIFCVCIDCLCVCFIVSLSILVKLSAPCHVVTCFFVDADAVDFSLVTPLFCFISLDTLLATFFCLYWVFMCVFPCVSLQFLQGFLHGVTLQLVSLLMLLTSHSWQLSLFYFIRCIIGNFFCDCIECLCVCFLASLCNFCEAFCILSHCNLFLCWCCWFLTCDNSLCFISLGTLLEASNYSLWLYWVFMCVFTCIIALCLCEALCVMWHHDLFLCCCCCCLFFLTHGTHQTCGMSSDWSKRCWQIYCN